MRPDPVLNYYTVPALTIPNLVVSGIFIPIFSIFTTSSNLPFRFSSFLMHFLLTGDGPTCDHWKIGWKQAQRQLKRFGARKNTIIERIRDWGLHIKTGILNPSVRIFASRLSFPKISNLIELFLSCSFFPTTIFFVPHEHFISSHQNLPFYFHVRIGHLLEYIS